MAVSRWVRLVSALLLSASVLQAESPFRLQRTGSSNDEPRYPGSVDEKLTKPVRTINLQLPNGTVAPLQPAQAPFLDAGALASIDSRTHDQRAALDNFARKSLVPFLRLLRRPGSTVAAAERVAMDAGKTFPGTSLADNIRILADAALSPEENEPRIRGTVAQLNSVLHQYGLHMTFGRFVEFERGVVELQVYWVGERLLVQISDRTVPVYVLNPYDEKFRVLALGMMEAAPPRIFIFKDMIDLQVQDIGVFLKIDRDYPFEDPSLPNGSIPLSMQTKINQIVRQNLQSAVGSNYPALERWLINAVARHEGEHLVMDYFIKAAAESQRIEWDEVNLYHERQAYLFELETSDSGFTSFALLASFAISAALSDKYSRVGCGAALRGLQKQLPDLKFWDADFNRPIMAGLIPLFNLPSAEIRQAASKARREVEKFLISAGSDPSAKTTADQ